jgi:hypothetical protein
MASERSLSEVKTFISFVCVRGVGGKFPLFVIIIIVEEEEVEDGARVFFFSFPPR